MMCKRAASLSFMLFSSGFAFAVYALFVLICDIWSIRFLQLGIFRTFGLNPLAAYIIHEMVGKAVGYFAPGDSPLNWVIGAFALHFGVTYLFVRHLKEHGIF